VGRDRLDGDWFVRTVPRIPRNLMWEITEACNLRCLHCESASGKRLAGELTPAEALDLCRQIVDMGWQQVNLTGGEPLMRRDWPDLARGLTDGGVAVVLVTNGLLLDDDVAQTAWEAGIRTVSLSLDGTREIHDRIRPHPGRGGGSSCFDAAVAAVTVARQRGMRVAVITHVNAWNFRELPQMHRLLTELEVDGWQLQLAVPLGRLREIEQPYLLPLRQVPQLEAFAATHIERRRETGVGPAINVMHSIGYYGEHERTIRRGFEDRDRFFLGCVGAWRVLGITADGKVKPCSMNPRSFAVADLREESLESIWNDTDRLSFQTHWDPDKLEGYCRECKYRHLCRAGCTSMAYGLSGTIYNNPYCIYRMVMTGEGGEG
jgi:radical SAM protein with 4Fe4S-binding SPASM domain